MRRIIFLCLAVLGLLAATVGPAAACGANHHRRHRVCVAWAMPGPYVANPSGPTWYPRQTFVVEFAPVNGGCGTWTPPAKCASIDYQLDLYTVKTTQQRDALDALEASGLTLSYGHPQDSALVVAWWFVGAGSSVTACPLANVSITAHSAVCDGANLVPATYTLSGDTADLAGTTQQYAADRSSVAVTLTLKPGFKFSNGTNTEILSVFFDTAPTCKAPCPKCVKAEHNRPANHTSHVYTSKHNHCHYRLIVKRVKVFTYTWDSAKCKWIEHCHFRTISRVDVAHRSHCGAHHVTHHHKVVVPKCGCNEVGKIG